MPARIYITELIHEEALALLQRETAVDVGNDLLDRKELLSRVADVEVILSKTDPILIDAELMKSAPLLRLVTRHGSGFSNVDMDYATSHGIAVSISAGINVVAISEYTIGLMLSAARCLPQASVASSGGAPERTQFCGLEMNGKIFGIVGLGRIGRAVAERALALGMRVLAYHPRLSTKDMSNLPIDLVDLDRLLTDSDVVSLHVPLTPETGHLIGARELAIMKPQSILLNLSRGGVVDEVALFNTLSNNQIFAAATDVLKTEPVQADEPLLGLPNCIVMPHIAAMTFETQRAIALSAANQSLAYLHGNIPDNIVNPDALKHPNWKAFY